MSTIKEEATRLVKRLPEHATWDDLMYQVYVHQKLVTEDRVATAQDRPAASKGQDAVGDNSTFSQRWRGKFVPANRDDDRYRALAKRFL